MLKAGGDNNFEVVLTQELEVLATLMYGGGGGGRLKFPPIRRGVQNV